MSRREKGRKNLGTSTFFFGVVWKSETTEGRQGQELFLNVAQSN
jgi:hypothetical protein